MPLKPSPLTSVALCRTRFAFIPYSREHITRHTCGQCPPAYGLVWVVTAGTVCAHVSGQPMMSARSTSKNDTECVRCTRTESIVRSGSLMPAKTDTLQKN